jgi:two-component system NtrC family sensor kinase
MILVPAIPFFLVLLIGFYYFKTTIESSTLATLKRIARDHREMIETFLYERRSDLEFVQATYSFDELMDNYLLDQVFARLQLASKAYTDIGVFNKDGVHVAYKGPYPLTGRVYKDAPWFKEVSRMGVYISDVFLGVRNIPHFVIAVAKDGPQGRWVIRATIDSETFNEMVRAVHIGDTGEAYILNREGILQTNRRGGGEQMESPGDTIHHPPTAHAIHTFVEKGVSGSRYLYATSWLKGGAWVLVIRQEVADAFKNLRSTAYLVGGVSVFGGIVILLVAVYMTDRIVRRLERVDAEKEHMGQQLIGASRLAEIGEMATGFAHEINNPLQIMKSEQALMTVLMDELKDAEHLKDSETLKELEDSMAQIDLQITRCSKITQSILQFGRQKEPTEENIALEQFIPGIARMVESKAAVHGIAFSIDAADSGAVVRGDPAQLQQVLINLLNNAIDAIVDRHGTSGGQLKVAARRTGAGTVQIDVVDNGSGIRPENLKKVFSPFFTTKPVGRGTGLGLSVCFGIVNTMGGKMEVASQPGEGTTFTIQLPLVDKVMA